MAELMDYLKQAVERPAPRTCSSWPAARSAKRSTGASGPISDEKAAAARDRSADRRSIYQSGRARRWSSYRQTRRRRFFLRRRAAWRASGSTPTASAARWRRWCGWWRLRFRTGQRSGISRSAVMDLADVSHGMVLVTGTAGSGKSTTQACIIDRINRTRKAHIITLEDPIEFLHRDQKSIVSQREIAIDTGGLSLRPARLPAPGAGRDPAGRDAGPRDHPHRHDRGGDRPPADRHACTPKGR